MEQHSEFTIHVDGIGYVSGGDCPPFICTVGSGEAVVFDDDEQAYRRAQAIAGDYRRLGLPDLAERVRVQARTVTVTREEWRDPIAVATVGAST